jgi:acetoin utilization protein AcuB
MDTREMTVADIMTRDVVTVYEEDDLNQVRTKLSERSFHHLPVVDGNKLVGMLSQRDMLRATVAGSDYGALAQAREARYLEQSFVRDIMETRVRSVRPGDSLRSVAQRLLEFRVGALPVTDEQGNLIGIVTENDLVRQLALGG